jgi:hypothetical protein
MAYKVDKPEVLIATKWQMETKQFPFSRLTKPGDLFVIPRESEYAKLPHQVYYAANEHAKQFPGFHISTILDNTGNRIVRRVK